MNASPNGFSPASNSIAQQFSTCGLEPTWKWPWVHVGHTNRQQGWKLHLTCTPTLLEQLVQRLIALYETEKIPFKVADSIQTVVALNEGAFGDTQIGKCATLYPIDDTQWKRIAEQLRVESEIVGPRVPDDISLGGNVYTRYGAFKPEIHRDMLGQLVPTILDIDGKPVADGYSRAQNLLRYQAAFGPIDPFGVLQKGPEESLGLMSNRYLVIDTLRDSGKGCLFQALDTHAKETVRPIILKEGPAHVLSDMNGYDIRDRLRHQFRLHEQAAPLGIAPVCDSYFEIDGNGYLPIEYKMNINFEEYVQQQFKGNTWDALNESTRTDLLSKLINIGEKLAKLHGLGIVHRDLSPSNILLDESGEPFLSDLEIAWFIGSNDPVFGKGTPGFMSPEQHAGDLPTLESDVFGFSAICLYTFTGIDPRRLPTPNRSDGWKSLRKLAKGLPPEVWSTLHSGMSVDATARPHIDSVIKALRDATHKVGTNKNHGSPIYTNNTIDRRALLERATATLASPALRDPASGLWLSAPIHQGNVNHAPPEQRRSFNRGVAGVLYYCACYAGHFSLPEELISACQTNARWLLTDKDAMDYGMPGLHFGESGVLLAIYTAREAGLIDANENDLCDLWNTIFEHPIDWPDITHGAAGIALALDQILGLSINAPQIIERARTHIQQCLDHLISKQNPDGSWTMPEGVEGISGETLTGFAHGSAGIAFTLAYFGWKFQRPSLVFAAERTAKWLLNQAHTHKNGALSWPYSDRNKDQWLWWCHGAPGIAYLYWILFRVTDNVDYIRVCERCFENLPPSFNPANLSLCHGSSGLGEIMLDISRCIDSPSPSFTLRAETLAQHICARHACGKQDVYWCVENPAFVGADLLVGMCGPLHFLLRLETDDPRLSFPGLPFPK